MDTGGTHPDPGDLSSLDVFRSLSRDELTRLAKLFAVDEAEAGKALSVEGDVGSRFFVILEGEAEVLRNGSVVRRLGPGDHFGEIALLSEGGRTASVVAVSPLRLLVMFGTAFRAMEEDFPSVAKAFYADAARRLDADDERA